jgi:signal transduction histidine kinase
MAAVLLAGLGGGLRLAASLGQPFPSFALMWRKELNLYVVSNVTPPYWPGIAAGLRINDRIRCVDGYMPLSETAVYGLDANGDEVLCHKGSKSYFEICQQRHTSATPEVDIIVQRQHMTLTITAIPVVLFDLTMLLETFLPAFLLGLGFLGLGDVVLRAGRAVETNLVFALFATIMAAFAVNQAYAFRIGSQLAGTALVALVLVIAWVPFLGAVVAHMLDLLTPTSPLASVNRRLRRPYYYLSALVAIVGSGAFVAGDHPLVYPIGNGYLAFVIGSLAFAVLWGLAGVGLAFWQAPSQRVRRQTGLILASLAITVPFMIPYALYFLTAAPALNVINNVPYLGLALVALLAYAILRYQVFASRARILRTLLVAITCILIANLVYLLIGQRVGILPIMAATLLTGLALEARQGPMSFFNRLLRREVLDYRTVAQFSEQVGQLQKVDALLAGIRQPLYDSLDIEHMAVWLLDPAQPGQLQRFVNGEAIPAMRAPEDLTMTLLAQPDPLRANQQPAQPLQALATDCEPIAVWAPLVERGEVAGILGLGPRWTGEVYGEQDLKLIGILARQMTLSILNTRQLERLQAMSHLIAQAEENERRKIARELHDTILQFLLVLTYGLDDLKERQSALTAEIERWQERISAEAGQLRSLLSYLRAPELLVQQGLVPSLESWLAQVQQETAMAIETDLTSEVEPLLSTEAKVAIYRVCREAVHNAIKHSGGSRVVVKIWRDGEAVRFVVEDDGQGFDVEAALAGGDKGYSSLNDLRIYVENMGGQLELRSTLTAGTTVRSWLQVGDSPILARPSV